MNKKKNISIQISTVTFIVLLLLVASFSIYSYELDKSFKKDTYKELELSASMTKNAVFSVIEGNFNIMMDMVASLQYNNVPIDSKSVEDLLSNLSYNKNLGKLEAFSKTWMKAYQKKSQTSFEEKADITKVLNGERTISQSISKDSTQYIELTVPIFRKNKVIGMLKNMIEVSSYEDLLNIDTFDGEGKAYLISGNGASILHADSGTFDLFTMLTLAELQSGYTMNGIKEDIRQGRDGIIYFKRDNQYYYGSYTPLNLQDWYLYYEIPGNIVESLRNDMRVLTIKFGLSIILLLFFLMWYIVWLQDRNSKRINMGKQELETLVNTIPGGVAKVIADDEFTVIYGSEGFYKLTGYTKEEYNGGEIQGKGARLIHKEDLPQMHKLVMDQILVGACVKIDYRLWRKDGTLSWIGVQGNIIENQNGLPILQCVFSDVTDVKQALIQLEYEQERYSIITEQSDDIIFEFNVPEDSIYISHKWKEHFGYSFPNQEIIQRLLHSDIIFLEDKSEFDNFIEAAKKGVSSCNYELRLKKSDGEYIWSSIKTTILYDKNGKVKRAIGKITDIDLEKREKSQLIEDSQRDPLTQLYNKLTTQNEISNYLSENGKEKESALLIIDIDNFKGVNDNLGHLFGDAVLKQISSKLQGVFRNTDIVGRIGGDEFVVFIKDFKSLQIIMQKSETISSIFKNAFTGENGDYKISGSIGIAIYPKDGVTYEELLSKADRAMYSAKLHGKDRYELYDNKVMEMQREIMRENNTSAKSSKDAPDETQLLSN